jgi:hypothetical protein
MRYASLFVVALLMGYVSPWLASPDDGVILFLWFNWLPNVAAQWFVLGDSAALALDVLVLAAQYLALFAVVWFLGRPAIKFVGDFARAHRHRSGLVR